MVKLMDYDTTCTVCFSLRPKSVINHVNRKWHLARAALLLQGTSHLIGGRFSP